MIDLIEQKYRKVFTNLSELCKVINSEFNTNMSEADIYSYDKKYYDIDSEDKKIHYKCIT